MEGITQFLQNALADRVARNPRYSLRAFARDLGVSHSYLSLVFNGKKRVSVHQAAWFAETLGSPQSQTQRIAIGTLTSQPRLRREKTNVQFRLLELDKVTVASSWYHWAILEMTQLKSFRPDVDWIANELGVTSEQVTVAVDRLKRLGLLVVSRGVWKKSESYLAIDPKRSEACLRHLHREFIRKAENALNSGKQADFDRRAISSSMMAANPKRMAEARKRINRFRRSLIKFLSVGECTEVYQFNAQLFPLMRGEGFPETGEQP